MLFMVDDLPNTLKGFAELVQHKHPEWHVEIVTDPTAALSRLHAMSPGQLPTLISVDLGLQPRPDATEIGLELLRKIHTLFGSARLAVHSALKVEPETLQDIVGMRASYIRLRDLQSEEVYASFLPWLAEGYLFYSPTVAEQFSEILPQSPDPLDEDEWAVARLLAAGNMNYADVASAMTEERFKQTNNPNYTMGPSRVQQIVGDIVDKLRNANFITASFDANSTPNRYKPLIIAFYTNYHVKYHH
jgi:DNA-binding NarL/FixJ family response regulator